MKRSAADEPPEPLEWTPQTAAIAVAGRDAGPEVPVLHPVRWTEGPDHSVHPSAHKRAGVRAARVRAEATVRVDRGRADASASAPEA